jgi:hypothetical protein
MTCEVVESIMYKGHRIDVYPDTDGNDSPRDWDNLGVMYCWHKRYNLGDWEQNDYSSPADLEVELTDADIVLPLYLYDHSGITMSTSNGEYPFCDRWDSGQVGYIVAWAADVRKEYSVKRISKQLRAKVIAILRQEVKTYDQYLTGDIYGYCIFEPLNPTAEDAGEYDDDSDFERDDEDDRDMLDSIDSVWGFYGLDYCLQEAKEAVDWRIEHTEAA